MKVVVESEVTCCADCPHSTNEAREWDDPFTSPPADPSWWCTNPDKKDRHIYSGDVHEKIADDCPIVKKTEQEKGRELAGSLFEGKDLTPEQINLFEVIIGGGDHHTYEIIQLIKKCLINQRQRQWLFKEDLDLHDIMGGRYPAKIAKRVSTMLKSWNKKAGANLFYED